MFGFKNIYVLCFLHVKGLRARVCICGVGTYEPMFSCKNMSVLPERICRYLCLSVWLVHMCLCSVL